MIFATARPPSKSGAAVYRPLWRRLLHSVRRTVFVPSAPFVFLKAKTQYVLCYSFCFLIMFSGFMFLLHLATSMIELFILDLVIFMIYLFRNLIIQLPNYSTNILLPASAWRDVLLPFRLVDGFGFITWVRACLAACFLYHCVFILYGNRVSTAKFEQEYPPGLILRLDS